MPNSKNSSNNKKYSNHSSRNKRTTTAKKEHILVEAPQYSSETSVHQQNLQTDVNLVELNSIVLDAQSTLPVRSLNIDAIETADSWSREASSEATTRQDRQQRRAASRATKQSRSAQQRERQNAAQQNTARHNAIHRNITRPSKLPLFLTALYLGLLITSVFIVSGRLYNWSLDRTLSNSPLAELEMSTLASSTLNSLGPATTTLANTTDFVRNTYSGLGFGGNVAAKEVRPINILLLGTDARPTDGDLARTDSIILLSINPDTHAIGMISLPRDLWVPIPGYNFPSKINLAYIIGEERNYPGGGSQLAVDTISSFIGRPIDYYVRINFDGFVEFIDQIGGIDLVVPKTIHDEEYPTEEYGVETFHLDAGQQHLDGDLALKYARTRHTDDDYARARRQQLVIESSIDKIMSANVLTTLVPKLPSLLQTMRNSIDTNIRTSMIYDLAKETRDGSLEIVYQLVLDSAYGEETYSEEGAWILLPDREKTRVALEEFFRVVQAPPTDGIVQSHGDDANWVRVEVLNGTGQPRVAAMTRQLLQSDGWHVVSIDDADRSDYTKTLVVNYGAESELVDQISGTLGLADLPNLDLNRVQSRGSLPIDIRIVVGRDILPVLQ